LGKKRNETSQGLKGVQACGRGRWKATNCKAKEAETESIQRRQTPTNSMAKRNHRIVIALKIPCNQGRDWKGVLQIYSRNKEWICKSI